MAWNRISATLKVHVAFSACNPAEIVCRSFFDFENGHLSAPSLFGWGVLRLCGGVASGPGSQRFRPCARNNATDNVGPPRSRPPGQKSHQHEQQTQGPGGQPVPDKGVESPRSQHVSSPVGMKENLAVQERYRLILKRCFPKYLK